VEAAHLAVARFLKAHGLKGAVLVEPLTDTPAAVFVAGRRLVPMDEAGAPSGPEVVLRRGRPNGRAWLLEFAEVDSRTAVDRWPWTWLGARREELVPPRADQLYVHEIAGTAVVSEGRVLGVARELAGLRGEFLVVEIEGREHLIPFRRPIVRAVDRAARRIEVDLPPGFLEL
jgi:16S rRNA processing protein RimM